MARFNILCRGTADEVIRKLEDNAADEQELRVVLQNAFQRIKSLEARLAKLEKLAEAR